MADDPVVRYPHITQGGFEAILLGGFSTGSEDTHILLEVDF